MSPWSEVNTTKVVVRSTSASSASSSWSVRATLLRRAPNPGGVLLDQRGELALQLQPWTRERRFVGVGCLDGVRVG